MSSKFYIFKIYEVLIFCTSFDEMFLKVYFVVLWNKTIIGNFLVGGRAVTGIWGMLLKYTITIYVIIYCYIVKRLIINSALQYLDST